MSTGDLEFLVQKLHKADFKSAVVDGDRIRLNENRWVELDRTLMFKITPELSGANFEEFDLRLQDVLDVLKRAAVQLEVQSGKKIDFTSKNDLEKGEIRKKAKDLEVGDFSRILGEVRSVSRGEIPGEENMIFVSYMEGAVRNYPEDYQVKVDDRSLYESYRVSGYGYDAGEFSALVHAKDKSTALEMFEARYNDDWKNLKAEKVVLKELHKMFKDVCVVTKSDYAVNVFDALSEAILAGHEKFPVEFKIEMAAVSPNKVVLQLSDKMDPQTTLAEAMVQIKKLTIGATTVDFMKLNDDARREFKSRRSARLVAV